jgi:glycosyltransferase involved in cell wall biosynthesis
MTLSETATQKTFSVIMATYNCGRKVENTIQSVLSQNKELFELIVIDGASTDNTLDDIKKYESDLTLISEKDEGVYGAFNKGIDRAKGKYIYFIGAGDRLRPGVLEQINEILPCVTAPGLIYGDVYLMKQKIYKAQKYCVSDFIFNNICHQTIFYHRDVFDILGKYDSRYKVFADWVFNLRCFTEQRINKQYIPRYIADFEEGGLSSELKNDPAFKKDFPRLVKKYLGRRAHLKCKAFMINPKVYFFCYRLSRALPGYLISLGRPYIQGYRHLKKTIRR